MQTPKQSTIPQNTEAELAVLGSIMIDPRCLIDVTSRLDAEDFYLHKHRLVFEALQTLNRHREPLDYLTITTQLERSGHLETVGGAAFIASLISRTPTAINVKSYAEMVHETAVRRRLLEFATDAAKLAHSENTSLEEVLTAVEGQAYALRSNQRDEHLLHIRQAAGDVFDELEAVYNGIEPPALPTGYTEIDAFLDGWRRQELTIVAARPGIGKTALLCNLATKAARAGHGTLIFSAEMNYRTLVKRMLKAMNVTNLPKRNDADVDWPLITEGLAQLGDLPLWIDDTPNASVLDIRAKALRIASEHRIDLIAVDYIQLLRSGQRIRERYLEIGAITKTLKNLARELNCHVIAASQLSRTAEEARPMLSNLKESGTQEEDADTVIFIHRQREIPRNIKVTTAEIIIAKQRNGPTGTTELYWMPRRVCFLPKQQGQQ